MTWQIKYHNSAYRFLKANKLLEKTEKQITIFLKGNGSADISKLKGKLAGNYRLRLGKVRVILEIDFEKKVIYLKKADFRGDVYK